QRHLVEFARASEEVAESELLLRQSGVYVEIALIRRQIALRDAFQEHVLVLQLKNERSREHTEQNQSEQRFDQEALAQRKPSEELGEAGHVPPRGRMLRRFRATVRVERITFASSHWPNP